MLLLGSPVVGVGEQGEPSPFGDAQTVEEYVRDYFADIPKLAEVAKCESEFRHFNSKGDVLRGKVNRSDVGVMQINEYYHGDTAATLDLDLYTLDGNLEYARSLYEREGMDPWNASRSCWEEQHLAKK